MRKASKSAIVPAFAMVREAGRRFLNMRHFDVQLIGGMVLHDGNIAEMKTVKQDASRHFARSPQCASRARVHIVTVNDYLAARRGWMSPLYRAWASPSA